jgi:hypothetical protein
MEGIPDEQLSAVVTLEAGDVEPALPAPASFRWREILAVVLLVVLCDVTIYYGEGFAGVAMLLVVAPFLLLAGHSRPKFSFAVILVAVMLLLTAAKMIWCGSIVLVAVGAVLLFAFAMSVTGQCPFVIELFVFASQTIRSGYEGFSALGRSFGRMKCGPTTIGAGSLAVALPLAAFVAFGLIFVLANPDLFKSFSKNVVVVLTNVREWLSQFSAARVLFWLAAAWISVGLLRPVLSQLTGASVDGKTGVAPTQADAPSYFYAAFRNTLATVIGLFAVYLVFEFKTLWIDEFPETFYYAGYAHEGAAWLTLALALATAVLSLIFRGNILNDSRTPTLRMLAWIWSVENFVLALAVYNRLFIYINYNGMTRMRLVGVFGITCVVIGFALVLWKIAKTRNFIWLLRRHLLTLAIIVFLFAVTPIDAIVVSYNVRRVLAGDPKPAVQFRVHPPDVEGLLFIGPVLDCDNEIIRDGMRAVISQRYFEERIRIRNSESLGWTTYQLSDKVLLERLEALRPIWDKFDGDRAKRDEAGTRFREYVNQWY